MDHYKIRIEYTSGKHSGQVELYDHIPADQILDRLQAITQYQLNHAEIVVQRGSMSVPYHDFLYHYYNSGPHRILN